VVGRGEGGYRPASASWYASAKDLFLRVLTLLPLALLVPVLLHPTVRSAPTYTP
jgi:hypothetical protein